MAEIVKRTQDEMVAELTTRFGDNPMDWAFVCPSCGDVATGGDFRRALDELGRKDEKASDRLGQECIGRLLGSLNRRAGHWQGRGCDWCAYGLFRGPEFVVDPDGKEIPCFRIAPAPEKGTSS